MRVVPYARLFSIVLLIIFGTNAPCFMCEALQMCSLNWMLIIIEHTLPLSFSLISAGLFILFWQQYVGSRPASTRTHTHHAFPFDQYHRTRSSPAPVSKVPKWRAGWETSRLLASRSISQTEAENMKPLEPRWNAQRQSRFPDRLEGSLAPRWLPVPGGFTRHVFSYVCSALGLRLRTAAPECKSMLRLTSQSGRKWAYRPISNWQDWSFCFLKWVWSKTLVINGAEAKDG